MILVFKVSKGYVLVLIMILMITVGYFIIKSISFKERILNMENDKRNCFDQPVNDPIKKYDEIRKTLKGQRDYYTIGCLLDYSYCKDHS